MAWHTRLPVLTVFQAACWPFVIKAGASILPIPTQFDWGNWNNKALLLCQVTAGACVQVDAKLWVLNGMQALGHATSYMTPDGGCRGLDHDLMLMRAWAATAVDEAGIMGCVPFSAHSDEC